MKVEIKSGKLIIEIPITERDSKSGKNLLIATTSGNKETDLKHKGKNVVVSVNAYVRKD